MVHSWHAAPPGVRDPCGPRPQTAFIRAGDGPALLLLHGIGNNCQTWAGVIDRLAETHTVIAPDLLGHGNSDKPRGDYSIASWRRLLAQNWDGVARPVGR